ncbi:hypothetical protein MUP01_00735 [Candidatus Bathyarchaeota archaeon]|nr:hypothetical protein [Candidatus Bathyarchaeota archaeon]
MTTTLQAIARQNCASGLHIRLTSGVGSGYIHMRASGSGTGATLRLDLAPFSGVTANGTGQFGAIKTASGCTGTGDVELFLTGLVTSSDGSGIMSFTCTGSGGAAGNLVLSTATTAVPKGSDFSITTLSYNQPAS